MNTLNIQQAIKMDKILSVVSEGNGLTVEEIARRIEIDDEESEHLLKMLRHEIKFQGDKVITPAGSVGFPDAVFFRCYNTDNFKKYGGCQQWFKEQVEIQQKEKQLKELEKEKLLNDLASFKLTKKQFYWTIGLALGGFLLSCFAIAIQIFNLF